MCNDTGTQERPTLFWSHSFYQPGDPFGKLTFRLKPPGPNPMRPAPSARSDPPDTPAWKTAPPKDRPSD